MGFLDNYEDVNARIKRFRSEFPSGRLIAFIEDIDLNKGTVLIRAEAYREYEDAVPSAVDYAFGNVATLTNNMKKWLIEDTVTSAYGRVIGLLTPSLEHNSRPTVQDMEKVENLPADPDPWSTHTPTEQIDTAESQYTCRHGAMVWAEGKSKSTGEDWGAYRCTERDRAQQCKPVWHEINSSGKWVPQIK